MPPTEQRNPLSANLDDLSTLEILRLFNRLDATVPVAVAEALPQIAQVVDQATATLASGGRLFYQGAGTSGRLAVLDAVELLPTFSLEPGYVIPLLAGGDAALTRSVEGAEDDEALGRQDLVRHHFAQQDMLIGLAASGRTPYVLGSTRLRAGTAQKLVLNMVSTGVMVKLGKVYGNLMVDVQPTNQKLRERAVRIVQEITGLDPAAARTLLERANWRVKTAVVMELAGVDGEEAARRLAASGGLVRGAVG
ncbi:MAG: N-acetylmuramic acid 6-phosphate etherase [Chloroflexi bacterium]|nr:MAG: N-acetylmuramic acid 6-phosphate etherase [Chloroflexota bacterium]